MKTDTGVTKVKTDTGVVGQFAGRMARLKEQRQAAQAEAERAAERLKELGTRRARLAPAASSDEKGAAKEIAALVAALDEESASVSRTKTVAEDSVRGLDRLVMAAEVRHHEEAKRLAQGRYEALCKERYRLDGGAEEAMSGLVEVLDRLESLHVDQVRAATDAGDPFSAQHDPRSTIELWLMRRLRRWLANGGLEKYETSLPELDPLAWKPEPEDEQGRGWG